MPARARRRDRRARATMTSRVLGFVFLTVFLDMIGFGIVIPLLSFYVADLGGTAQVVGLILGSFSLMQVLATPILGRLSDRFGRRPIILASLAGNAVAMAVFAVAVDVRALPLLFASRILAGATAGNLSACQAAVADVTDGAERAGGMGRIGAAIGLGLVVGPVLGSALTHIHRSAPPLAAAALACLDLAAVWLFMPETRGTGRADVADDGTPQPSLATALRDPRIVSVMIIYFLTFLCMTNFQVSLPLLSDARLGWRERQYGWVFGLYGFMALLVQGRLIGILSRRYSAVRLLIVGAVCIGAGMAAIAVAHGPALLLLGVAITGVGVGLTSPTLATLASLYAGRARQGAILGFTQSAGGAGRTVGPWWSGLLYDRAGTAAPFLFGVAAAAVSTAIATALTRRADRT